MGKREPEQMSLGNIKYFRKQEELENLRKNPKVEVLTEKEKEFEELIQKNPDWTILRVEQELKRKTFDNVKPTDLVERRILSNYDKLWMGGGVPATAVVKLPHYPELEVENKRMSKNMDDLKHKIAIEEKAAEIQTKKIALMQPFDVTNCLDSQKNSRKNSRKSSQSSSKSNSSKSNKKSMSQEVPEPTKGCHRQKNYCPSEIADGISYDKESQMDKLMNLWKRANGKPLKKAKRHRLNKENPVFTSQRAKMHMAAKGMFTDCPSVASLGDSDMITVSDAPSSLWNDPYQRSSDVMIPVDKITRFNFVDFDANKRNDRNQAYKSDMIDPVTGKHTRPINQHPGRKVGEISGFAMDPSKHYGHVKPICSYTRPIKPFNEFTPRHIKNHKRYLKEGVYWMKGEGKGPGDARGGPEVFPDTGIPDAIHREIGDNPDCFTSESRANYFKHPMDYRFIKGSKKYTNPKDANFIFREMFEHQKSCLRDITAPRDIMKGVKK